MHIWLMKTDDWQVLYVDGKKKLEGHSLSTQTVLQLLIEEIGIPDTFLDISWVEEEKIKKLNYYFDDDLEPVQKVLEET